MCNLDLRPVCVGWELREKDRKPIVMFLMMTRTKGLTVQWQCLKDNIFPICYVHEVKTKTFVRVQSTLNFIPDSIPTGIVSSAG